jgi:hypothetical protein
VRLVRAGMLDRRRLICHLKLEFGISCEQSPAPVKDFYEGIVDWALNSDIAERERNRFDAVSYIRQRQARAL